MISEQNLDAKIQENKRALQSLEAELETAKRQTRKLFEELDISPEELGRFFEKKEHFTPGLWEEYQRLIKESENQTVKNKPRDPKKTSSKYKLLKMARNWIPVR